MKKKKQSYKIIYEPYDAYYLVLRVNRYLWIFSYGTTIKEYKKYKDAEDFVNRLETLTAKYESNI
jgi:hypothetical protein